MTTRFYETIISNIIGLSAKRIIQNCKYEISLASICHNLNVQNTIFEKRFPAMAVTMVSYYFCVMLRVEYTI